MIRFRIIFFLSIFGIGWTTPLSNAFDNRTLVKRGSNDDATYVVDKLSIAARVVTGITLLNGLSDGSVPVDSVISELLNLGSFDLKSLEDFDKTKVDAFIDQLKNLQIDNNAASIEIGLSHVYEIRKLWKTVGDFNGLPDKATYGKLKKSGTLDDSELKKLDLDTPLSDLSQFATLDDSKIATLQTKLTAIAGEFKKTEAFFNYPEAISILDQLKPFETFAEMYSLLANTDPLDVTKRKSNIDAFVSNVDNVKQLFSKSPGSSFETVSTVIKSRFMHHPTDRSHTSGFVNGFDDLDKLQNDVNDKWLLQSIHPTIKVDGVTKLVQLKTSMKSLDDAWTQMATENSYNSMRKMTEVYNTLKSLQNAPPRNELESLMTAVFGCQPTGVVPSVTKKLEVMKTSTDLLKRKLPALHSIHELAKKNQFDGLISKLAKGSNQKDVEKIKEVVQKMKSVSNIIKEGKQIGDIVKDMGDSSYVSDLKTNAETVDYVKSFECLGKLDQLETVAKITKSSSQIDAAKNNGKLFGDVKSVAQFVSGTTKSLKSIRTLVEKIKADQSKEGESLAVLKNLEKLSKPFGEAVNALVLSKKISEKSQDFKKFFDNGKLVEAGAIGSNNKPFEESFRKEWGDFHETERAITLLMNGVVDWLSKMKVANKAALAEFSPIFQNLPTLKDVELNTENRLAAVENYRKNNKPTAVQSQELDTFKTSLLDLSKLDLKFARFDSSVISMPQTLKDVSDLLAKNDDSTGETSSVADDPDFFEEHSTYIIIFGVLLFLSVCLCCVYSCFICCCHKKNSHAANMWKKAEPILSRCRNNKKKPKKSRSISKSKNSKDSEVSKETKESKESKESKTSTGSTAKTPSTGATESTQPSPSNNQPDGNVQPSTVSAQIPPAADSSASGTAQGPQAAASGTGHVPGPPSNMYRPRPDCSWNNYNGDDSFGTVSHQDASRNATNGPANNQPLQAPEQPEGATISSDPTNNDASNKVFGEDKKPSK